MIPIEECYICNRLKTKNRYYYKNHYTSLVIEKGDNKRYRVFAYGEYGASVSCNFCPNCGRQLEEVDF